MNRPILASVLALTALIATTSGAEARHHNWNGYGGYGNSGYGGYGGSTFIDRLVGNGGPNYGYGFGNGYGYGNGYGNQNFGCSSGSYPGNSWFGHHHRRHWRQGW